MNKNLKHILFSFLLGHSFRPALLSGEEIKLILKISAKYILPGMILQNLKFSKDQKKLERGLVDQKKITVLKTLAMKADIEEIIDVLNKEKFTFVFLKGAALNLIGVYNIGTRGFRDLDILVNYRDVEKVFLIFRKMGYKYVDKRVSDRAKFLVHNHLPCMSNERGTIVEIHWRVTPFANFEKCPLSKPMLNSFEKTKYTPNIELLLGHILYHGVVQHKLSHGPIFLFDMAALFRFNDNKWPEDLSIMDKLGISDEFKLCKKIIESCNLESTFSTLHDELIEKLLVNFDWHLGPRGKSKIFVSHYSGFFRQPNNWSSIMSAFVKKMNNVSGSFQVSYSSPKFWILFLIDLLQSIGRLRF